MSRRLLVIGATGLVGAEVARVGSASAQLLGVARTAQGAAAIALDWTRASDVAACVASFQPTHIAVAAAWPHVDGCEADTARSERENVRTIHDLLAAAPLANILFFSTDHVFDGEKSAPYVETDEVRPLSVYAKHKRAAEELLLARGCALVVRTAWVFGAESRRKNFVYRVIDAANAGRELVLPSKQSGCPTHATWLAANALDLFFGGMQGAVHLSGNECLTKAEWARTIALSLDLPPVAIREVPWAEAGQLAPRPARVALASCRHSLTQPSAGSILRAHKSAILT